MGNVAPDGGQQNSKTTKRSSITDSTKRSSITDGGRVGSKDKRGSVSLIDVREAVDAAVGVQMLLAQGTAVERFVHFVQKRGVPLIEAWLSHQRPFLVLKRDFKAIFAKTVQPEVLDESLIEAFWQLWRGNCTIATEPEGFDLEYRLIQDPEKTDVVEMLQLMSTVCLLLPLNAIGRVEELMKLYDFDFLGGFTRTGLPIALGKAAAGCNHLCGLGTSSELLLSPAQLDELHQKLLRIAGHQSDNPKSLGLVSPTELAAAIPPLLHSLCRQAAVLEESYRNIAQTVAVCRDDLLPETEEGALFLGRYRVIARQRTEGVHWFKRLTLIVEDLIERQRCAVKVLITRDADPPQHARTFLRGAALLSKIEHPAIPKVRSYGQTREFLFQIMDCLEGCTLASKLEKLRQDSQGGTRRRRSILRDKPKELLPVKPLVHPPRASREGVSEVDIISMLEGLCDVLSAVHAREIVHGDLSPNAVFLAGGSFHRGAVRVLSWDQASWDAASSGTYGHDCPLLAPFPQNLMDPLGESMLYVPPERCESIAEGPRPAWDLYALGCIAFESICLRPPFLGLTPLDQVEPGPADPISNLDEAQSDARVDTVHRVLGSIPAWLEDSLKDDGQEIEAPAEDQNETSLPNIDDLIATLRKEHMEVQPPDTRGFFTSDDLVDIVERLMEKQPADRYASADTLVAKLGRVREKLEGLPSSLSDCLAHLGGQKTNTFCLDMQQGEKLHTLDDFTSRYLAKFATELTVDHLKVTGSGEIPLDLIRDPRTTELKLSKRRLTSKDILVLARAIDGLAGLRHLDISANAVAYETSEKARNGELPDSLTGLKSLCAAITHMEHLVSLDLSANMLGGVGGVAVCTAVAQCIRLETIRLPLCGIGDAGAKAMAASISSMPALASLDLSHCGIGDAGAAYLAAVFGKGEATSLRTVSLPANRIADDGGTALMSALECNFELLVLSLAENKIPDVHLRAIERAVAFNNQYLSLKQRNDKFDGFGHSLMAEALQTWAKGNMFIARRLEQRLRQPRDELEKSVAQLLLNSEANNLTAFLDEIHSPDRLEDADDSLQDEKGAEASATKVEEEIDPKDVELVDDAEVQQDANAIGEVPSESSTDATSQPDVVRNMTV